MVGLGFLLVSRSIHYLLLCNYHTHTSLKKHTYFFSQFPWVRSLGTGQLGPLLRVSQAAIKVSARAGVLSEAWDLLKFTKLLAELTTLQL